MSLAALIAAVRFRPGWRFRLEYGPTSAAACTRTELLAGPGLTVAATAATALPAGHPDRLVICLEAEDTATGRPAVFEHRFAVPPDPPGPGCSWHRWVFARIEDVRRHEDMEAFAVGEVRPFYPEHGPDARLYEVIDRGLAA
jgi:hypothetical protein